MNETLSLLRSHWRILTAATLGWALDAFDATIYFFLIPHLGKEFGVDLKAMSLVLILVGIGRIIGTVGFGAAADKWGRKLPFMIAIVWFCFFSGLSGLAWGYMSFLAFRFLFSVGYGGEWSTGTSLLMESIPPKLRSLASGLMMAGYEVGYLLAAFAFYQLFPILGWRWMFFIGVAPALLAIFVRRAIPESPEWLATRKQQKTKPRVRLKLNPAMIQAFLFMLGINCCFYAVFALYPTFLIQVRGLTPAQVFPYVALYSVASLISKPAAGLISARIGERPFILFTLAATVPIALLYTYNEAPWAMAVGALLMGLVTNSVYGVVPAYLSRRFRPEERGLGMGIASAFNSVGVVAPYTIATFTATYGLSASMTGAIMVTALFAFIVASARTDKWIVDPEDVTKAKRESEKKVLSSQT
jgi:SHS family lactate transporter-like MFS transporter